MGGPPDLAEAVRNGFFETIEGAEKDAEYWLEEWSLEDQAFIFEVKLIKVKHYSQEESYETDSSDCRA
jgi:hypothetical protein